LEPVLRGWAMIADAISCGSRDDRQERRPRPLPHRVINRH